MVLGLVPIFEQSARAAGEAAYIAEVFPTATAINDDGVIKVTVDNVLNSYESPPDLIIALYNKQNKLIALHTKEVIADLANYPFDTKPFDGAESAKIFLWDSMENLIPVSELICISVVSEHNPDYTNIFEGDGTKENPYKIENSEQLAKLSEAVNNGIGTYSRAYYILENNLDLSIYNAQNTDFNGGKGWIPIGTFDWDTNLDRSFAGHFDGQNRTIANMYINDSNSERVGLFGHTQNAAVRNLGIINVNVTAGQWVGAVAGDVCAENESADIENCYSTGAINGECQVGGITGFVYGENGNASVKNCYSSCAVRGTQMQIGGVAGDVLGNDGGNAIIENCYSTGTIIGDYVVGGVAGSLMAFNGGARIENCYSISPIFGKNSVGGIVGDILAYDSIANIKNNAALNSSIDGVSDVGRIVGSADTEGLTGELYSGNVAFMALASRTESGNDGESKNPAQIRAADFFNNLFGMTNSVWIYVADRLPILNNLQGQNDQIPPHIPRASTGDSSNNGGSSSNIVVVD